MHNTKKIALFGRTKSPRAQIALFLFNLNTFVSNFLAVVYPRQRHNSFQSSSHDMSTHCTFITDLPWCTKALKKRGVQDV